MFTVLLVVILTLPSRDEEKPVIHAEPMATIAECNAAVREMTYRAPAELKNGGRLQVGCVIKVPPSENP
jgi:hypothetical protein